MSEKPKTFVCKKGELLQGLHVEGITMEGFCLSRVGEKVVFLRGGAPGDTVDIIVTKVKKNFLEGYVSKIGKRSPHRKEPFCTHFGVCGGCTWQHVDYGIQLRYKQQFVQDSFERIAGIRDVNIRPILPCTETRYYRNRLDFTFGSHCWLSREEMDSGTIAEPGLGFHIPRRFDKVFDVQTCYLQPDPSNAIRLMVKRVALNANMPFFDIRAQTGFLRTLTLRTTLSGEVMVILQVAYAHIAWVDAILKALADTFSEITSLYYVVNTKPNDTFYDQEVILWRGSPYITEWVSDRSGKKKFQFRIEPKSFYQTNSEQAYHLYMTILDMAGLTGDEVVYDLYTGVGTIATFAATQARRVVGVEFVESAVQAARANAQLNGLGNIAFFAGDVKTVFNDSFLAQYGMSDVVITDPPRAGMHEKVILALLSVLPKKIIYVSCNPATQARDIKMLSQRFSVDAVQPIDMFPHTNHVETVTRLSLR